MSLPSSPGSGLDFNALLTTLAGEADPLRYLAQYLAKQRVPSQGPFFKIHAYVALGVHGSIVLCILLTTWARSRRDQLWFTRRQQGRLRLNATVIALLFIAIYSSMAIAYTSLLLYQQETGRYLAGSAAFQLSCFASISFCISVIAFTYHQSLPVGFESPFLRRVFRKKNAAADHRFFGFTLLCIWLAITLAGTMAFPLIHDYWRRQVDATLEGTITYLQREDVRERGLPALVGIVDQISELPHQIEQAQLALRRQLLVFIGHCGLYLVVILPVAIKLLSLVSEQMRALRRSAEDYFRLGTRINLPPPAPSKPVIAHINNPRSSYDDSSDSGYQSKLNALHLGNDVPKVALVACNACNHQMTVDVQSGKVESSRRQEAPRREQPRQAPRYTLHPDFPLHKLDRLRRVRVELAGFSVLIVIGLANFLAWCCVCYGSLPEWSSADATANLFVINLWCYAVPAGISSVFYAYTTALLAPSSSQRLSIGGGQGQKSGQRSQKRPFWRCLPFCSTKGRGEILGDPARTASGNIRIMYNRRSRPTFPRVASNAAFGDTFAPTSEVEMLASQRDGRQQYSHSSVGTLQWIEQQQQIPSPKEMPRAPSRISIRSLRALARRPMPQSMTQSWLEIEED